MYRLGLNLNAPRPRLCLADFLPKTLPAIPAEFGHENLIAPSAWGVLGNDRWGDCVFAGAAHEHMVWTAEGGKPAQFDDKRVLKAYSAVTGFDPRHPNTDQGTDMDAAAKYRRKHGIIDSHGHSHKISAYVDLKVGSLPEFLYAAYFLGAVGLGIKFPAFAMDQFNAGQPWDVDAHGNGAIDGGHYVPVIARRAGVLQVVTWGKVQQMSDAFFEQYCDQGIAYLSPEILTGGKSPEGLDIVALKAALAEVTQEAA